MSGTIPSKIRLFQSVILVHLDSAYNYAYWLTRDPHDAEDLTQEACTRAYTAFDDFEKTNAKAWLMTIIRHAFLNQKQKEQRHGEVVYLDSHIHAVATPQALRDLDTPERLLFRQRNAEELQAAINQLSDEYREVIILREMEGLSYNEISTVTDCAIGTVMSRLSRAREQLKNKLSSSVDLTENQQ